MTPRARSIAETREKTTRASHLPRSSRSIALALALRRSRESRISDYIREQLNVLFHLLRSATGDKGAGTPSYLFNRGEPPRLTRLLARGRLYAEQVRRVTRAAWREAASHLRSSARRGEREPGDYVNVAHGSATDASLPPRLPSRLRPLFRRAAVRDTRLRPNPDSVFRPRHFAGYCLDPPDEKFLRNSGEREAPNAVREEGAN